MIRPVAFRLNAETAVNNHYQKVHLRSDAEEINLRAQQEFDVLAELLLGHHVDVHIFSDTLSPHTPDSLFPNNWISFHDDRYVIYPMQAANRRLERRKELYESAFPNAFGQKIKLDYSAYEESGKFLEGTGSLVLDRINKLVFASLSERTSLEVVNAWCDEMKYEPVVFQSNQWVDHERKPIYHTNVMMSIATEFAIICLDAIDDRVERAYTRKRLEQTGREVIPISEDQVDAFLGNALELSVVNERPLLVMSSNAFNALMPSQKKRIEKYSKIIHSSLETIETYGGGSARCMIAEVY